jgi:hypothetical protein
MYSPIYPSDSFSVPFFLFVNPHITSKDSEMYGLLVMLGINSVMGASPTNETLEKITGRGQWSVSQRISRLERFGYIRIQKNGSTERIVRGCPEAYSLYHPLWQLWNDAFVSGTPHSQELWTTITELGEEEFLDLLENPGGELSQELGFYSFISCLTGGMGSEKPLGISDTFSDSPTGPSEKPPRMGSEKPLGTESEAVPPVSCPPDPPCLFPPNNPPILTPPVPPSSTLQKKKKPFKEKHTESRKTQSSSSNTKGVDSKGHPKRFTPPSPEEAASYAMSIGWDGFDPDEFIAYYEMRDWCITNGRRIKDWRAAIRYWKTRRGSSSSSPVRPRAEGILDGTPDKVVAPVSDPKLEAEIRDTASWLTLLQPDDAQVRKLAQQVTRYWDEKIPGDPERISHQDRSTPLPKEFYRTPLSLWKMMVKVMAMRWQGWKPDSIQILTPGSKSWRVGVKLISEIDKMDLETGRHLI